MTGSPLERLTRRASAEPTFLGRQLAAFARLRGFDETALAAHLDCPPAALVNVRLCGAVSPERFRDDVTCVAEKFGRTAWRLAERSRAA
jgi:hypothetical protein